MAKIPSDGAHKKNRNILLPPRFLDTIIAHLPLLPGKQEHSGQLHLPQHAAVSRWRALVSLFLPSTSPLSCFVPHRPYPAPSVLSLSPSVSPWPSSVSPLVTLVFLIYLDIKTYPTARDLPHIGSSTHWNSPNQAQMVLDSIRAQAPSARPLTLPTMARNRLTGHVFHNFDRANCAAFSATGAFHSETLCLH